MARRPQLGPQLPFGPYLPDQPAFGSGARTAQNVIPSPNGYRPFPDVTVYSAALTARCQGAFSCTDSDGTAYSFAGDATKLYRASNTAWTNYSGTTYACGAEAFWDFTQFGDNVIACDGTDATQTIALGSATTFSNLGGSPPVFWSVATVGDFVIGLDATQRNRVVNSAINNSAGWTIGTSQCDESFLQGEGNFGMKVIGGEYATIFGNGGVWRMDYQGPPVIFNLRRMEDAPGLIAPLAAVKRGGLIYYMGLDGFYVFNGITSQPIGRDQIDKSVFGRIDANNYHRISAVADPIEPIIIWAIPISGNIGGNPNLFMILNWRTGGWSEIDLTTSTASTGVELIWRDLSAGYTLDGLDSVSASLDALTASLDSRQWAGGALLLATFNGSHKNCYFTGDALAATIDTAEAQLIPGQKSYIDTLRAIADGGTITVKVGYRDIQTAAVTWTSAISVESDGSYPVGVSARYARGRMLIAAAGTWSHAQGFDAEAMPDGMV